MSNVLTELYNEFARDYERTRVPRFRPFVKRMLQFYDTRPGSFVLDAGCGTGLAATMVAPRAGHNGKVLGVDASVGMLEIAREKAHGYGFDQCEFVVGDMTHVQAPDDTFDVILCSFSVWTTPVPLLSEFYRLLKPNGALLLQNWNGGPTAPGQVYRDILAEFTPATVDSRLEQLHAVYAKQRADWQGIDTTQAYEIVVRAAGFTQAGAQVFANTTHFKTVDEWIEFHDLGVAARLQVQAMTPETRDAFHAALYAAAAPFVTTNGLDEEWRAIQVSARK